MKYVFYSLIALSVLFAGFLFYSSYSGSTGNSSFADIKPGEVVKIKTEIKNRSYIPARVDVPFGAVVELTVVNNDNEQHSLNISQFGISGFIDAKSQKTVRFTANKRGQVSTFCAVDHPEKFILNVL